MWGTHVKNSAQIGLFKITSESGIAAGVRRIEAITGQGVYEYLKTLDEKVKNIGHLVKGSMDDVEIKVGQLTEDVKSLSKEIEKMKTKAASNVLDALLDSALVMGDIHLVTGSLKDIEPNYLRDLADKISNKLKPSVVVLASVMAGKIHFIAMVDELCVKKGLNAGKLIKQVTQITGGGGGGRPNMAQGSGSDVSKLQAALESVKKI